MAVDTSRFRNGLKIELDGEPYTITYFQHVKPGKGGAFVRTKVKSLKSGKVRDKRFRAGEKVELADIEERRMQYLYQDGESLVFMDNETYEQLSIPPEALGPAVDYLVDGSAPMMQMYGTEVIGVELPAAVELVITETEPGLAGDRVSGARTPATRETGLVVQVPLFIEKGETIKVDTRSGEYLSRG